MTATTEFPREAGWAPSPEEIHKACLAIQAEWPPEEEIKRRVVKDREWAVPEVGLKKPYD